MMVLTDAQWAELEPSGVRDQLLAMAQAGGVGPAPWRCSTARASGRKRRPRERPETSDLAKAAEGEAPGRSRGGHGTEGRSRRGHGRLGRRVPHRVEAGARSPACSFVARPATGLPRWVVADRGYSPHAFRARIRNRGARPATLIKRNEASVAGRDLCQPQPGRARPGQAQGVPGRGRKPREDCVLRHGRALPRRQHGLARAAARRSLRDRPGARCALRRRKFHEF